MPGAWPGGHHLHLHDLVRYLHNPLRESMPLQVRAGLVQGVDRRLQGVLWVQKERADNGREGWLGRRQEGRLWQGAYMGGWCVHEPWPRGWWVFGGRRVVLGVGVIVAWTAPTAKRIAPPASQVSSAILTSHLTPPRPGFPRHLSPRREGRSILLGHLQSAIGWAEARGISRARGQCKERGVVGQLPLHGPRGKGVGGRVLALLVWAQFAFHDGPRITPSRPLLFE